MHNYLLDFSQANINIFEIFTFTLLKRQCEYSIIVSMKKMKEKIVKGIV